MSKLTPFLGFPDGKVTTVPVPTQFFSELLPQIDHLGELKITLYCFWALHANESPQRYVLRSEMAADARLIAGLGDALTPPENALDEALERAVQRGTLLSGQVSLPQGPDRLFLLNTEKGRAAWQGLQNGAWQPSGLRPLALAVERPTLFALYEQNIGPLTPLIADHLRDFERDFGPEAVVSAIQTASQANARHINYIKAVLERQAAGSKRGGTDLASYFEQEIKKVTGR
jgi:DnaD/phage-associated family protein